MNIKQTSSFRVVISVKPGTFLTFYEHDSFWLCSGNVRSAQVLQLGGSSTDLQGVATPGARDARLLLGEQRHQLFPERCCSHYIQQEVTGVVQEHHVHEDSPSDTVTSLFHRGVTDIYIIVNYYSAIDRQIDRSNYHKSQ